MTALRGYWVTLLLLLALAGYAQRNPKHADSDKRPGTAAPTAPPAVLRPYLMALLVRNADTTQAWYTSRLGFVAVDTVDVPESQLRIRFLEKDGYRLELVENATTIHPDSALRLVPPYNGFYGYSKLCFATPDLDALDRHLRALGTRYFFSVRKEEVGENSFVIVYDPDGNLVQVVEG